MASFRIVRFSKGHLLKKIEPENLLTFLGHESYAGFLERAEIELPVEPDPELIPYDRIAEAFMELDPEADENLINALYFVDSFSKDSSFEELLTTALDKGLIPDVDDPLANREKAMDLALRVWLHPRGPEIMAMIETKEQIQSFRSFQHMVMAPPEDDEEGDREYSRPDVAKLGAAAAEMRPVFKKHRRGESVAVAIAADDGEEIWFQVTHGDPLSRNEVIRDDDTSDIVVYRPKESDVIIYNKQLHELRTNVSSKWQLKLYREQAGKILFDDADVFEDGQKYNMEKFREKGRDILDCSEIEGIQEIRLKEIEVAYLRGDNREFRRWRAEDLFEVWGAEGNMPRGGQIVRIGFAVKFTGSKSFRTVTVSYGRRVILAREEELPHVEAWLRHHDVVTEDTDAGFWKTFTLPIGSDRGSGAEPGAEGRSPVAGGAMVRLGRGGCSAGTPTGGRGGREPPSRSERRDLLNHGTAFFQHSGA